MKAARAMLASILIGATAFGADAPPAAAAKGPSDAQAALRAAVAKVYDTSTLHRIEITIAPEDTGRIVQRTDQRISCTFSFDGVVLRNVGIRQSGGAYHPYVPIERKPSFSIKFDEFVDGQELHGLEKIILKNGLQDYTWVNEHMTYEVFRRAGLAAPMTAHAHVVVNGIDLGLYVMREPINKQFLTRNFGKDDNDGNLYEIGADRAYIDFADSPRAIALKDEREDGRSRDDLNQLARIVSSTPASGFAAAISTAVDLVQSTTYVAAEVVTGHIDGLSYRNNNTYLYRRERDNRFVWIPYGADQAFAGSTRMRFSNRGDQEPTSAFTRRMLSVPALHTKLTAEIERLAKAPVWHRPLLHARLEAVARILAAAPKSPRLSSDIARFESYRALTEAYIDAGGNTAAPGFE